MKKIRIALIAVLAVFGTTVANAQSKTETIQVNGNCGMCQKKIEKAASKAGAEKAAWDENTKVLTVTYDADKTSNDAIQKNVAAVGYDTEKYTGDDKAYKKLDACCQYERKNKK